MKPIQAFRRSRIDVRQAVKSLRGPSPRVHVGDCLRLAEATQLWSNSGLSKWRGKGGILQSSLAMVAPPTYKL